MAITKHGNAADEAKRRKQVDGANQIANGDLMELQFQPGDVHDSQTEKPFSNRLAVPEVLAQNAVEKPRREIKNN